MKRISFYIAAMLISGSLFAQSVQNANDNISINNLRTIEVVGSASIELEPDQVFVSFTIKDYTSNGKVITIDKSEAEVKKILSTLCIDAKNLSVVNVYGYMSYAEGANASTYQSRKSYRLKLDDVTKITEFISRVDKSFIESINIDESSHSDLTEHYKFVRIQAVKSAKDKACDLLQGFGEKCGRVLKVEELELTGNTDLSQPNVRYQQQDGPDVGADTQKIKVSYQVKVLFEIK